MKSIRQITLAIVFTIIAVVFATSCGDNSDDMPEATDVIEATFDEVSNSIGFNFCVFTKTDRSETIYFVYKGLKPKLFDEEGNANEEFLGKTFRVHYHKAYDEEYMEELHYINELEVIN